MSARERTWKIGVAEELLTEKDQIVKMAPVKGRFK